MMRTPAPRTFTRAEKRSLKFETVALYVMLLVAIIAAIISFVALVWVGHEIGLNNAAYLVPFAVDGFAIACSVGIIRSQAEGEKVRGRLSEWLGLAYALGLSLAGNVVHALNAKYGTPLPEWLVWAYAAAPPIIVAYGLHVYGRAQSKGISAHVLEDDPNRIHFGIAHLGDDTVQPAPRAARTKTAQPAREVTAQPAAQTREEKPAKATRTDPAREALFEEYRTRLAQGDRMPAKEIATALQRDEGNARTLRLKWDKRIAAELEVAAPPRDEILEQLTNQQQAARSA